MDGSVRIALRVLPREGEHSGEPLALELRLEDRELLLDGGAKVSLEQRRHLPVDEPQDRRHHERGHRRESERVAYGCRGGREDAVQGAFHSGSCRE